MSKSKKSSGKPSASRRGFLKGAAAGAAALATQAPSVLAQRAGGRGGAGQANAEQPNGSAVAREDGNARPTATSRIVEHPGSDYMVDVIKSLGFEHVAFNPG